MTHELNLCLDCGFMDRHINRFVRNHTLYLPSIQSDFCNELGYSEVTTLQNSKWFSVANLEAFYIVVRYWLSFKAYIKKMFAIN